jgi:hypothetical protein
VARLSLATEECKIDIGKAEPFRTSRGEASKKLNVHQVTRPV